ncbi:MAG TPA: phosphoenolpyruvate-utilizing N-terminal domain-containing protein, partial [Pyrinomonadaceae bacterium]|nr:phosphoenolpyruvate-utilizing N-terminal domain-containing protein [Pyrinomonadaceae bacterium]
MNDAAATSERRINGLAVSHGIGIGRLVFFLDDPSHLTSIAATSPEVEAERISSAAASCRAQLNSLIAANQSGEQPAIKDILDLQLLILDQSSLIGKIEAQIVENGVNAESALKIVAEELVGRQSTVADPHLREKHLDIADVCNRLEAALQGLVPTLENKYSGAIVAARELRPSVMIELKKCGPAGIITERGGWTSHTSILARELIIPMVSGVQAVSGSFAEGCDAIVDGENGLVIFAPSKSTV